MESDWYVTPVKGLLDPQKGHDPQVENYRARGSVGTNNVAYHHLLLITTLLYGSRLLYCHVFSVPQTFGLSEVEMTLLNLSIC